jgi:hypothetical protein
MYRGRREEKKPNITIVIACSPKGDRGDPASEATSKKKMVRFITWSLSCDIIYYNFAHKFFNGMGSPFLPNNVQWKPYTQTHKT